MREKKSGAAAGRKETGGIPNDNFLELKEKLKEIYAEYGTYILPAAKFLLALAVFQSINHSLNYVPALGNIFIVLILSLICAIIPLNGMVFLLWC